MTGHSWLLALLGGSALSLHVAQARAEAPARFEGPGRPGSSEDAPERPLPVDDDGPRPAFTARPLPRTPATPPREVTQPHNRPSLAWILTQLVPSPGMWISAAHDVDVRAVRNFDDPANPVTDVPVGTRFFHHRGGIPRVSLSWQVTPVLYSFGVNRRVSPWRFLVVDPYARNSGSLEWHFSPEWIPGAPETNLFYRTGFRTTLPLHQHGEYVALMLGASYSRFEGKGGIIYEGGLSLLFGTIGLVLSHSPAFPDLRYGIRLNLKYF